MGKGEISKQQQLIWLGLILLTAVFLRLWQIGSIPPGLTHDEADHGITAWSIVNGERAIYFTVGYGREPLYDYATAFVMRFIGPTYLAGRLTAVFFSIATLVVLYLWAKQAFGIPTALITAAGFAVGFWSVMSGRQSLRSITLGAFFVAGMWLYFYGIRVMFSNQFSEFNEQSPAPTFHSLPPTSQYKQYLPFIASGLLLGLAFYTYIPARALWFVVPSGLFYLLIVERAIFKQIWAKTAVLLTISLIVAAPLFSYLNANPSVEVRIQELSAPLTAAREGDFQPLLQNVNASLRLFMTDGDSAWRYNIAGTPFLPARLAPFFMLGLLLVVWWAVRPLRQKEAQTMWRGFSAWIVLSWLLLGFAPVLITGPELASTQAIGIQPVLYLLPAISLAAIGQTLFTISSRPAVQFVVTFYILFLLVLTAVFTFLHTDYWGNQPEVRVQYESTMFTAMEYVNENLEGTAVSISTITPGRWHTPALAAMTLTNDVQPRWFNASGSLVIPNEPTSVVMLPGFTPLNAGLVDYFETAVLDTTLPLQENDLDRPLDIYTINLDKMMIDWETDFTSVPTSVVLGENLRLMGIDIQTPEIQVGEWLKVATLWQIQTPNSAETKLFTHLLGETAVPIGQADRLDAPSESWQAGDWLIQLHEIEMTEEMVGRRPLTIGGYTCSNACQNFQPLPFFIEATVNSSPYPIGQIVVLP